MPKSPLSKSTVMSSPSSRKPTSQLGKALCMGAIALFALELAACSVRVSGQGKTAASTSGSSSIFKTKARAGGIKRSTKGPKFQGNEIVKFRAGGSISASSGSSASGSGSASGGGKTSGSGSVSGGGSLNGSGSVSGSASGQGSGSGKGSGSSSGSSSEKPKTNSEKDAKKPHELQKPAGSLNEEHESDRPSTSGSVKTVDDKTKAPSDPKKPSEPKKPSDPKKPADPKKPSEPKPAEGKPNPDPKKPTETTPPKKPDSQKPPEPTNTEPDKAPPVPEEPPATPDAQPEPQLDPPALPVEPIEPPEAPPENVFGYDKPIRGCFEGIVYPLGARTRQLPLDYSPLSPISVVYACEWDIPTREWKTGFPGVPDHFEWFAIRYTGSFFIEEGGDWNFRISSDDGAKLFIDGKPVILNDGIHPPREASAKVTLAPGDHDMVLEYFQGPRFLINLQLFATPPGGEEGLFSVR
jgi:PA14 domain